MIGIYLSGTGNTKHCIEKLTKLLDSSAKTRNCIRNKAYP